VTIIEMSYIVGKDVTIDLEGLSVLCKILDAKTAYGKVRLLVKPVSGSGSKWIETSRVKVGTNGL
jgi:hypothetical protein